MPIYTFRCLNCHSRWDSFVDAADMTTEYGDPCGTCHQKKGGRRVYEPGRTQLNTGFKPYVSADFDGENRYVGSKREEDSLCRINGVRRATESDMARPRKRGVETPPLEDDFMKTRMDIKYGNLDPKEVSHKWPQYPRMPEPVA